MKNFARKFLLSWIVNGFAIYLASLYLVNFNYDNPVVLIIVALIFGVVFSLIGPIIKLLSIPLFFMGPFIYIVVDAFLLWGISYFIGGFTTGDILTTLIAGGIVGIINFIAHLIV